MGTIKCAVEQILDSRRRGGVVDTNPRDSGPPRSLSLFFFPFFKRRCAVIPSRAPQRWWTLPLRQMSDFCSLFTITETIKPKVSDFAVRNFQSSDPASCRRSRSVFLLWSALPRMDHRSALRALLLPACVIICSNVLRPVGAFVYNNRYAGWVKTPSIHFWCSPDPVRAQSDGKAHGGEVSLIRMSYLTDGTKGTTAVRVLAIIRCFLFASVVWCSVWGEFLWLRRRQIHKDDTF